MQIPSGLPNQFLNWRLQDGRKVPCTRDGRIVSAHEPKNWITYEEALAAPYSVAFALTETDQWFFLDLDKCTTEAGEWTPEALAIWNTFPGAWGEVSQSGKGLHIMGLCDKSKLQDRKNKWDGWLEFYTQKRFIAFSDNGWTKIGGVEQDYDWTNVLLEVVPQREHNEDVLTGETDPRYTGDFDDATLINKAIRSTSTAGAFGGVTFEDLWTANVAALKSKYPNYTDPTDFDHSSADMALMQQLAFWTGRNAERMDRLFRMSALMRDKYENREDYRRQTVQKARDRTDKVYDKPAPTTPAPTTGVDPTAYASHEGYLMINEMIQHFEGCIYIAALDAILMPDGQKFSSSQFNSMKGGHMFQMTHDHKRPTLEAWSAFTKNTVHPFPKVNGMTFQPLKPFQEIIGDKVNTYFPPEIKTRPGDISMFHFHMQKLFPDARDREIVLSYCAAAAQNPGVKFRWAPVIQGMPGNGKSTLGQIVGHCFGEQYTHSPKASEIAEKFNGFIMEKLWIQVDEIATQNRMEILDIMKPMITDEKIEVRIMRTDKFMTENFANFFFCTNHRNAIQKTAEDRRYAIFYTPQQKDGDLERDGLTGEFFYEYHEWLRGGGYEMIAHYLLNYPIKDEFNPATKLNRAPQTTSTKEAMRVTLGGAEQEIQSAVERSVEGFRGGFISMQHARGVIREISRRSITNNRLEEMMSTLGYERWGYTEGAYFVPGNSSAEKLLLYVQKGNISLTEDNYRQCNGVTHATR